MIDSRARLIQIGSVASIAVLLGIASAKWLSQVRATTIEDTVLTAEDASIVHRGVAQATNLNPVEWMEEIDTAPLSITDTVFLSDHVYEGVVRSITTATFNTPDGTPPGGTNPIHDDDDTDAKWTLHRYAVVELTTNYTGPVTLTHMILPVRGGTYDSDGDGLPNYIHGASGIDLVDVAIDDSYLIYGVYPWTVPPSQAVGSEWEERGLDLASQKTAAGYPTTFVETYAAYKVEGSIATSITHHASYDLTWLRNITQVLTN